MHVTLVLQEEEDEYMLKKKMMMKEMENKGPAGPAGPTGPGGAATPGPAGPATGAAAAGPKGPVALDPDEKSDRVAIAATSSTGSSGRGADRSSASESSGPSLVLPRRGAETADRAPLVFMDLDASDSKGDPADSKESGRRSDTVDAGFEAFDMDGMVAAIVSVSQLLYF